MRNAVNVQEVETKTESKSSVNVVHRARDLLSQSDGNHERAKSMIIAESGSDNALCEGLLELGAREAVRLAMLNNRHDIIQSNSGVSPYNAEDSERVRRNIKKSFYSYQLTSGILLGDAKYKDLLDQAKEHERNETANSIRRRWFEILARRTKDHPKTIVRKILTEDDITEAASEVGLFN